MKTCCVPDRCFCTFTKALEMPPSEGSSSLSFPPSPWILYPCSNALFATLCWVCLDHSWQLQAGTWAELLFYWCQMLGFPLNSVDLPGSTLCSICHAQLELFSSCFPLQDRRVWFCFTPHRRSLFCNWALEVGQEGWYSDVRRVETSINLYFWYHKGCSSVCGIARCCEWPYLPTLVSFAELLQMFCLFVWICGVVLSHYKKNNSSKAGCMKSTFTTMYQVRWKDWMAETWDQWKETSLI